MVFCNKGTLHYYEISNAGHNPYFNRWFSAINDKTGPHTINMSHNPYFNRWFSAMGYKHPKKGLRDLSQSLF